MATRNILHRSRLQALKTWLGKEALPTIGEYEVLRWKGHAKQPMRIVFDNDHSCEHLSVNDAAYNDVMNFIKYDKGQSR